MRNFLFLFTGWHLTPGLSEVKGEQLEKRSSFNIKDIYFIILVYARMYTSVCWYVHVTLGAHGSRRC